MAKKRWISCAATRADGSRCPRIANLNKRLRLDSQGHWYCNTHWHKFVPEDDWMIRAYGPDSNFARLKEKWLREGAECFACFRPAETAHHFRYGTREIIAPACHRCNILEHDARKAMLANGADVTALDVSEEMVLMKIERVREGRTDHAYPSLASLAYGSERFFGEEGFTEPS